MSYPREAKLEKFIKDAVFHATADIVDLHIKTGVISIRHPSKKGSILLAKFWANVLQNPLNFPSEQHLYKRQRDISSGTEQLLLKAGDVMMSVNMSTGALQIKSPFVVEWFSRHFGQILENHNKEFADSWYYRPSPIKVIGVTKGREQLNDYLTETERYLLCRTTNHTHDQELEQRVDDYSATLIPGVGDLALHMHFWDPVKLDSELAQLSVGGVKNGLNYIYLLWKSLLNRWFGEPGTRVYMASPHLDTERLTDIVEICLSHKPLTNLETFLTQVTSDEAGNRKTAEMKKEVLQKFDHKLQPFVEYHILRHIMYPTQSFSAKFIAAVRDGTARVLVTSASFNGSHFTQESFATVIYIQMSEGQFLDQYIKAIIPPVVV